MRGASGAGAGWAKLATAVLIALVTRGAAGNDATFGGSGADLVPLSEQQIRMKSEDVVLTAEGYDWLVQADYVFENPGASTKVQVGFPEYRCEEDSDCTNVAFRDLETTVNGAKVVHRQGKLDKAHGWADFIGVVWLFDVEFPARKQVHVRHRYRLSSGGDVEGNLYTSYVTRTGRSWAGPIGNAKFTAVLPAYARVVYDPRVKGLTAAPPRLITDGTPRVELVLSGKNWVPEGGLGFSYNASGTLSCEPFNEAQLAKSDYLQLPKSEPCSFNLDLEEAQRCLNDLYAAKGYPFKNSALAKRYYSGNPNFRALQVGEQRLWLRDASPLAAFSPSWFLSTESHEVRRLTDFIASERKAAPASADTAGAAALELPPPPAASSQTPPAQLPRLGSAPAAAALERAQGTDTVQTGISAREAQPSASMSAPSLESPPSATPAKSSQCGCRLSSAHVFSGPGGLALVLAAALARRRPKAHGASATRSG